MTKLSLTQKIKLLESIRHEIKKKRVILDESKDKFGMEEMSQLIKVKNTSQVKGYPFKIKGRSLKCNENIAIKVVPIESKYEKEQHPCYIENMVLRELTDNFVLNNISPHVTHYLGTQKVTNKSRALKQLNLKRLQVEDRIRSSSNMLISEYVHGGSLDSWVFDTYENDKEVSSEQWKYIVFQLIYTIIAMQHHYKLMHNDFHYGNILIDDTIEPSGYFVYEINNKKYYLKNTGIIPKLWDFEFSMVHSNNIKGSYPNKFIIDCVSQDTTKNVPDKFNEHYDIHYLLTSLLDLYISQELFDFIMQLYPQELIPEESSSDDSDDMESNNTNSDSGSSSSTLTDSNISGNSGTQTTESNSIIDSTESTSDSTNYGNSSSTDYGNSSSYENAYLKEGRMVNGIEHQFSMPKPLSILESEYFANLTIKPDDFDDNNCIHFKAKL
jgi:hypothetical protein